MLRYDTKNNDTYLKTILIRLFFKHKTHKQKVIQKGVFKSFIHNKLKIKLYTNININRLFIKTHTHNQNTQTRNTQTINDS